MAKELIDLFSDGPGLTSKIASGICLGKPGARRYFEGMQDFSLNAEFLYQSKQLSGRVDVEPGGKTAFEPCRIFKPGL